VEAAEYMRGPRERQSSQLRPCNARVRSPYYRRPADEPARTTAIFSGILTNQLS